MAAAEAGHQLGQVVVSARVSPGGQLVPGAGQAPAPGSHEESLLQGGALALDTPLGGAGGGGGHGEVGVEGQVGAGAALQIGRLVTFPPFLQFGSAERSGSSNLDKVVAFLFLLQIDLFYKLFQTDAVITRLENALEQRRLLDLARWTVRVRTYITVTLIFSLAFIKGFLRIFKKGAVPRVKRAN